MKAYSHDNHAMALAVMGSTQLTAFAQREPGADWPDLTEALDALEDAVYDDQL